ncbi:MAG: protein translocase subunit SecF [Candidatus Niyogibacteria bacterium]|nr:protein translocase subunit SecF [Candidatus Niyogibacteria bacterium]
MIKFRKIFYFISGLLVILSLAAILFWGFKWGIDFSGGALIEVEFFERPPFDLLKERVDDQSFGAVSIQPVGEKNIIFRLSEINENEHQVFLAKVAGRDNYREILQEKRFNSVGPTIGRELKRRSFFAIGLVLLMIVLYIAFAFRKVSYPVSSWKYGLAAIAALAHDVLIPAGIFSVLGYFKNVEIDVLFITALLTILSFSVHDTIVVFDRVRENLKKYSNRRPFEEVVDESLRQTVGRSLATSFALLIVLVSLFVFGAESVRYFSLTMIIGIIVGTYSSIFIASPLLVTWQK